MADTRHRAPPEWPRVVACPCVYIAECWRQEASARYVLLARLADPRPLYLCWLALPVLHCECAGCLYEHGRRGTAVGPLAACTGCVRNVSGALSAHRTLVAVTRVLARCAGAGAACRAQFLVLFCDLIVCSFSAF